MKEPDERSDEATDGQPAGYRAEISQLADRQTVAPPTWLTSMHSFWIAAGVMSVVLFALIPIIDNGYIALPDEGVYSAQADALTKGSWEQPRPAPELDPKGYFDPVGPSAVNGDMRIPYGRHPVYGLMLSGFYGVGGHTGMIVFSILGGIAAAIFTGLTARLISSAYGIPALLLTGLGSPLLFNSYIVVAHNIATAMAAVAIFSALKFLNQGKRGYLISLAVAAFVIPCFRTEGSVFVGSAAIALIFVGIPIPKLWTIQWRPVIAGLVTGVCGVAGYLVDIAASRSIIEYGDFYTDPAQAIGGDQAGPLRAAWIAMAQPWSYGGDATIPALAIIAGVILAALSLRLLPKYHLMPLALLFASTICSIWWHFSALTLVTGLIATMPILFFGIVWILLSDLKNPITATLALIVLVSMAGLIATIYSDGGAAQWGGRLLQVTLPAFIPLTIMGIDNARKVLPRNQAILAFISLVILVTSTSLLSLRANRAARGGARDMVSGVEEVNSRLSQGRTLTLFARGYPDGSPRALWQVDTRLNVLSSNFKFAYTVVEGADEHNYDTVIFITDAPDRALTKADRKWDAKLNLRRQDEALGLVSGYRVFVFSKPKG